jgi:membrane-bound serine protease (ClpP class)
MLKRFWLWLVILLALFSPVQAQGDGPLVLLLTADGPLTPAMKEYLMRGIELAERRQAEALIFQLDTPGGSVGLMTEMVQVIRASRVPVIIYVAPRGAMAGSAGTVITLAGHAAAMAPETAIGAASPVGSQGEDLARRWRPRKRTSSSSHRSLAGRATRAKRWIARQTIEAGRSGFGDQSPRVGLIDLLPTM